MSTTSTTPAQPSPGASSPWARAPWTFNFWPRASRPRVHAAVAAVIPHQGRLLAGRWRGTQGSGHLAFPGGSIEPGETLAQALEREVLEETGLVVTTLPYSQGHPELFLINHIPQNVQDPAQKHYLVVFLEARLLSGELRNTEPDRCEGWSWLTLAQLASQLPPEGQAAYQQGQSHESIWPATRSARQPPWWPSLCVRSGPARPRPGARAAALAEERGRQAVDACSKC